MTPESVYLHAWLKSNTTYNKQEQVFNVSNVSDTIIKLIEKFGWVYNCDSDTISSPTGKNSTLFQSDTNFPQFESDDLLWIFLRGYVEYQLSLEFPPNCIPVCCIRLGKVHLMKNFKTISTIPYVQTKTQLKFYGTNAIDFLGKLYDPKYSMVENTGVFKMFKNIINMKDGDELKVYKTDENAVLPSKGNFSDVGYDLTIIKSYKRLNKKTILYDTGIKVFPKFGYYTEIVPRSSLSKSGYMLANSIGVIENSYSGNLFIALTKIDENSPNLTLPFKCCQLVIREQIYHSIKEIKELPSNNTTRGEGGFGSTNVTPAFGNPSGSGFNFGSSVFNSSISDNTGFSFGNPNTTKK